ncbi:hypothetical protein ColLi_13382 [Colletotrichum liriopes]|uniref:Uncharacterized protein n=1 Tax=Colletotrichum liriopes TaxID=708192 RepID=A0AA37H103_9PEZI|nr:hypothetical protein ColLi_13382 [Colletotrichum liriopes]
MPAFQPPEMTYEMVQKWMTEVHPVFRDPKPLWQKLWSDYNIMRVPVSNGADFFDNALAAAKQAKDYQDLEKILNVQYKERCCYLEDTMADIALLSLSLQTRFPSKAVRDAALKVGQSGSLDSLARFVYDVISGWKDWDDEGTAPQICSDDVDGGGADDDNAQDDTSEDGADPCAYENSFPSELNQSPKWKGQEGRWNGDTQRITPNR